MSASTHNVGMSDTSASNPERDYRRLPERTAPEDMLTTQASETAPDPTFGRDPDRDFMLRNAG